MNTRIRRSLLALILLLLAGGFVVDPVQPVAAQDSPDAAAADGATQNAGRKAQSSGDTAPAPAGPVPGLSGAQAAGARVGIVRIEGEILEYTADSFARRVEQALADGCTLIVVELNTPGGYLHTALKISKFIKNTQNAEFVAWVHDDAYSAGSLIAAACDVIVMSPVSAIGDTAPISMFGSLAPTERAKALSPLLKEFEDSAQRNGQSYALYKAMCVLGVKLYQVRHKDTGELRVVNEADYQIMVNGESIEGGSGFLDRIGDAFKADDPVAKFAAPKITATPADQGKWEHVMQVHDGNLLLVLSQTDAEQVGLSVNSDIRTQQDLNQFLAAGSMTVYHQSWTVPIAEFFAKPWVRAILTILFFLGLLVEMVAPGHGIGGFVALVAVLLLIGAPLLIGIAEVWHILLFFVGIVLLVIEIFFIPGFGVFGAGGIACMFIGLVLMAVPAGGGGGIPYPGATDTLQRSLIWMVVALIVSGVGAFFLVRHFGNLPFLERLMLKTPEGMPLAGDAVQQPVSVSGDEVIGEGLIQVGDHGVLVTSLRPVGRMEIDGEVIDVVSAGEYLDAGVKVQVVEVSGNRIVVQSA